MQPRQPVVISGPSGVGKGTLIQKLKDSHPNTFTLAVSHITRGPRHGEVEGVSYFFVSTTEFTDLVAQDVFIESTTFSGSMYGTSKQTIIEQTARSALQGTIVLLDIDLEGVRQMKASPVIPAARYVFIKPPSLEVLETRLRGRGTEKEEDCAGAAGSSEGRAELFRNNAWVPRYHHRQRQYGKGVQEAGGFYIRIMPRINASPRRTRDVYEAAMDPNTKSRGNHVSSASLPWTISTGDRR